MADIEARIEAQHGPNCTCTRLEPISFQPVIAGPNCPGEPTRYGAPTIPDEASSDEIHLIGWDGPIERLELRFKRGVEIRADWGRRIAEAARAIIENDLAEMRIREDDAK